MILEKLGKELLFFDGALGTLLQEAGLMPGELPEAWNVTHPLEVQQIHRKYVEAGSDILLTNTFGANGLKFRDEKLTLSDVIFAAVAHVKAASKTNKEKRVYVALDVGPTGKLLKPMGDLSFEQAYETFGEVMRYGQEAGADLIHIETMSDVYELKAAILAAKEFTSLPVFVTATFDARGKLLTGADVPAVVALLEGLRVDALGINCSLGPCQMMPVIEQILDYASLPVIVKPNAGLPKQIDGKTVYDVHADEFALYMKEIAEKGAVLIGGCCGTTPEHISRMIQLCKDVSIKKQTAKTHTLVSSYGKSVCMGNGSKIIGERINPTGKKKFKQALKDHDLDYILNEAITQQDMGAHILDVNVGLPDIDEPAVMCEVIQELQSIINLPLQIDTVDPKALEQALRIYNGKAMVNSVNGKQESMDAVFPLIQKYGGVVVGLALDEAGIPATADGRVAIAKRIITEAKKYGIDKKDIVIDTLALTVSSDPEGANVTLEALRRIRQELGVHTVLGVSNISFGLPNRPIINANFYTMAMQNGLSAGIINPSSEAMMNSYYSYHALMNLDKNCEQYIANATGNSAEIKALPSVKKMELDAAIIKGLKEEAFQITKELVLGMAPLEVINKYLIPALDQVGKGFEKGTVFLPQLLMSAEAAKACFTILKEALAESGESDEKKEKVVLATVKGDIHDIGKNIVKVLLENYGFDVIDLGKDVPPEAVVQKVLEEKVHLVGLSALMTTTVVSMEETIQLLREQAPGCKTMVGGAVMNKEYAEMIGADFYGKDAMQTVYYAQQQCTEK